MKSYVYLQPAMLHYKKKTLWNRILKYIKSDESRG